MLLVKHLFHYFIEYVFQIFFGNFQHFAARYFQSV
jgi:hypothetical protein